MIQNIDADAPSLVESDPDTLEMLHGGYTLSQFTPGFSDLRYRVYNATGNFDLGFGTLTSSSSYGTQKQDLRTDYTFALSPLVATFAGPNDFFQDQSTDSEKFTQELRLAGESALVDWLVGFYYTDEDGLIERGLHRRDPRHHNADRRPAPVGYALIESDYREVAGFANLTWHAGERFDIDLGGRYSDNKQSAHQSHRRTAGRRLQRFPGVQIERGRVHLLGGATARAERQRLDLCARRERFPPGRPQ